jgi:hypothetical protein
MKGKMMHPSKEVYQEYCAECRWNGLRPLSWHEWAADPYHPKADAQERLTELWENDAWDMY